MLMRTPTKMLALSLWAATTGIGLMAGQPRPDNFSGNQGKMTVLTSFTQGWGFPGPLIEGRPGFFTGLALLGAKGTAFTLTSQGALTSIYSFPPGSLLLQWEVQAINGLVYGTQLNPNQNFGINLAGKLTYYPQSLPNTPVFSVQLPNGNLYGTTTNISGVANRAFVRMTLGGAVTVLHAFTAQEGDPYGRPILASDGNFYAISGFGDQYESTSAAVYQMTPSGALKIRKTYSDGRKNYAPGSFPESLVEVGNGNLFGTASLGGSERAGAIFELSASGAYTVIHQFTNWDVGIPTVMVLATDGNLYGINDGRAVASIFRVTPAGQFETVYAFTNSAAGTCVCYLTQGSDGKFYGTSANGGSAGVGTAWVWDLGLPKPLPAVKGIRPASGAVGASVVVYGNNLLGPTSVSFNGVPAMVIKGISANYVSATVPEGATTGPVTVTTPNGTSTSPGSFTVE